ncbi:type IV pilus modification protein PilV [Rhodoferax sp. 4810]|nr:type IV pilus modification protein PilV [Rhodoferax jenense]
MKRSKLNKGATLIEILVALLVLSFGILGMAALQIRAVKGNHSAMQRTQAVMMSYYILDAMRVDRRRIKADPSLYNITDADSAAAFNNATLDHHNLKHWIESLKTSIGSAGDSTTKGSISCTKTGEIVNCNVKVKWDDSRANGLGDQTVETNASL